MCVISSSDIVAECSNLRAPFPRRVVEGEREDYRVVTSLSPSFAMQRSFSTTETPPRSLYNAFNSLSLSYSLARILSLLHWVSGAAAVLTNRHTTSLSFISHPRSWYCVSVAPHFTAPDLFNCSPQSSLPSPRLWIYIVFFLSSSFYFERENNSLSCWKKEMRQQSFSNKIKEKRKKKYLVVYTTCNRLCGRDTKKHSGIRLLFSFFPSFLSLHFSLYSSLFEFVPAVQFFAPFSFFLHYHERAATCCPVELDNSLYVTDRERCG